ncbi:MAG: transcriptional regulator NrdR [Alphaproteobacteria bacterium 16-39-46]|nr:MAG: transcriptional regulator NrdR [Rhodospirillales bacterium 35-44-4]OYZ38535.1 MAG: transcriptional regulator NrdR [Alphaproteobacteria bacterium 16-39-46]OZA44359.1 MAG: transcriptional regulator NrdR [Alphaproteobacteria bacterium 17-39-52]HQS83428.1 transcriptional regulator NrdR [Alphaproteobacteria bacterium]HQS93192.1 transcriptional regulator NrdR [Alphaproteobacteria bacterium]
MRCPFCGFEDTQVKDSRPTEDGMSIKRRRFCGGCQSRFTTFERVQLCELTVVKSDGRKESFSREKLARSIYVATRKRAIPSEKVERIINGLQHRLETLGESEISSRLIGEMIMGVLFELDSVSYIRFASVYKKFSEMTDFQEFIGKHLDDKKENPRKKKESRKYPSLFEGVDDEVR